VNTELRASVCHVTRRRAPTIAELRAAGATTLQAIAAPWPLPAPGQPPVACRFSSPPGIGLNGTRHEWAPPACRGYWTCSTNANATPITPATMASAMPSNTSVFIASAPEESFETVGGQFSVADGMLDGHLRDIQTGALERDF
jgi:hypothetical protein